MPILVKLIAQFSVDIEDYGWVDLEYHICQNFKVDVILKSQPPKGWIPVTFCTIDKDGNVKDITND